MTEMVPVPGGDIVDSDAIEIGEIYDRSRGSFLDSVKHSIECGRRLLLKQSGMKHGQWLPWLNQNERVLGFKRRAAQMMMKAAANTQPAAYLNEATALKISKAIWGHKDDSQLIQQSLSNEHYTPAQYLNAARAVLGGIDLDPASCEEANTVVGAEAFFTEQQNGLSLDWWGNVWLNPPYGGDAGDFVVKLVQEYRAGNVSSAVALVNAHCTDTKWFQLLWDGALCFTDHRINFYGDDKRSGSTHGSVFIYFGPDEPAFVDAFRPFGAIVKKVTT